MAIRFFLRDESGDPAVYLGSIDEPYTVKEAIANVMDGFVHKGVKHGEREEFTLEAIEMTDEQVAALPEG